MIRLLKEGRKFGIAFICCAHGDTAESLGSKGDTVAFRASFDWIVYCGAFVAPQLKDLPELVRRLPLGRTPEGGTFPLLVVAVSPVTGERRLLDLRGLERPTLAEAPAPVRAATISLAETANRRTRAQRRYRILLRQMDRQTDRQTCWRHPRW